MTAFWDIRGCCCWRSLGIHFVITIKFQYVCCVACLVTWKVYYSVASEHTSPCTNWRGYRAYRVVFVVVGGWNVPVKNWQRRFPSIKGQIDHLRTGNWPVQMFQAVTYVHMLVVSDVHTDCSFFVYHFLICFDKHAILHVYFADTAYRVSEQNNSVLPKIPVHPIGYKDAYYFLR